MPKAKLVGSNGRAHGQGKLAADLKAFLEANPQRHGSACRFCALVPADVREAINTAYSTHQPRPTYLTIFRFLEQRVPDAMGEGKVTLFSVKRHLADGHSTSRPDARKS